MSAAEAIGPAEPLPAATDPASLVLTCGEVGFPPLVELLARYGLELVRVEDGEDIPGSYWRESEAGMRGTRLFARADTPVHSLLHETCHVVCMDAERRAVLDTEAGGEDVEENAVCYLQLLLAGQVPGFGFDRAALDMDRWGYSFRLGSARAWFRDDADDARDFLLEHGLLTPRGDVVFRLRR
ncbi:MAG: hypothetical protein AAFX50_20450 [Acidobacteriota bacterium]